MNARILPSTICGEIVAPPSKSYAHRMLIASYLSGERVSVRNVGNSTDVLATVGALRSLGAQIDADGEAITIERKAIPRTATIDCNESGSTLRFLLPIAAALGVTATFTGKGRLLSRPIEELIQALNANGADIEGLTVKGKLRAGEYRIAANISSQYITGLLFALPLLSNDSSIVFVGEPVSASYLDVTLDVLQQFGIEIRKTTCGYYIKGNQTYIAPQTLTVEGDYSGAAFILSLGAICGKVRVNGLNARSMQGDAAILDILKSFGATVAVNGDCVSVEKRELNAITLNCGNIPDLVQIISVVSSFAQGVTVLHNVNRLQMKESNRLQAIIGQLDAVGVKCEYVNDSLIIYGGEPKGAILSGGDDHRTAMSATVLALGAKGESEIVGVEAISKSYPEFVNDVLKLGGKINVDV